MRGRKPAEQPKDLRRVLYLLRTAQPKINKWKKQQMLDKKNTVEKILVFLFLKWSLAVHLTWKNAYLPVATTLIVLSTCQTWTWPVLLTKMDHICHRDWWSLPLISRFSSIWIVSTFLLASCCWAVARAHRSLRHRQGRQQRLTVWAK